MFSSRFGRGFTPIFFACFCFLDDVLTVNSLVYVQMVGAVKVKLHNCV